MNKTLENMYNAYPVNVRRAIDRIAKRANTTKENVVKAYLGAARGRPVNAKSLFIA